MAAPPLRPVHWIGATREDLRIFPADAQRAIGKALLDAQWGGMAAYAKPLKGFGGASVIEIVESFDGDAFRAIYTVRFAEAIYVLHVFQKKAKRGIATPKHEIALIKQRLKKAEQEHEAWLRSRTT